MIAANVFRNCSLISYIEVNLDSKSTVTRMTEPEKKFRTTCLHIYVLSTLHVSNNLVILIVQDRMQN